MVETVQSQLVKRNQAIRLRARKALTDSSGSSRRAGEEWIVKKTVCSGGFVCVVCRAMEFALCVVFCVL